MEGEWGNCSARMISKPKMMHEALDKNASDSFCLIVSEISSSGLSKLRSNERKSASAKS